MDKPEIQFKAGGLSASVFMNKRKVEGEEVNIPSISLQKRYKDEDEWKTASSFNANDLPKAILVLGKAYDYVLSVSKNVEEDSSA